MSRRDICNWSLIVCAHVHAHQGFPQFYHANALVPDPTEMFLITDLAKNT